MNESIKDFICLEEIVSKLASLKINYKEKFVREIKRPPLAMLDNPTSSSHFSTAESASNAAQALALRLEEEYLTNPLVEWPPLADLEAIDNFEHQPELIREAIFLLGLLSRWVDRVASAPLPPRPSITQILHLARSRDRKRLENIGISRLGAERLVKSFVSRFDKPSLRQQMFASPVSPLSFKCSEGAVQSEPSVGSDMDVEADPVQGLSLNRNRAFSVASPFQLSTSTPSTVSALPGASGVTDFLYRIAKKHYDDGCRDLREVVARVFVSLDMQVASKASEFPFLGMKEKDYLFREKGREKILTAKKIDDRIRKNKKLLELLLPQRSSDAQLSD